MRRAVFISALYLMGCASTQQIPIVKVDSAQTSVLRYGHSDTPEARVACETRKMRRRALDQNRHNDLASVVVEEQLSSGAAMTAIDVNCREYFIARLRDNDMPYRPGDHANRIEPGAPHAIKKVMPEPKSNRLGRILFAHKIEADETLSSIARKHCVSVESLSSMNQISDPSHIHIGDVLRLPDEAC